MKIHLPNSAFLGNLDAFLSSIETKEPDRLEITANKKWLSLHPVVLCMVASLGLEMGTEKIKCEKLEAKSKHYLERMGLLKLLEIKNKKSIKEHESAGRFIPLTQIKNSKLLSEFITEMIPLLHLEPKQAEPIKYIISELVRNVLEHSEAKKGAMVCAQYYKKSNRISIGIVDRGLGIKKTINISHRTESHIEAIKLALTPGITGKTKKEGGTEFNAGAGLFFTKSIAKVNKDFFIIYSGDSMYKLLKTKTDKAIKLFADPFKDNHTKKINLPYWKGTVVGIDISLDKTEKFSMLLDLIRDTYIQAIRERKKENKKRRPKFI